MAQMKYEFLFELTDEIGLYRDSFQLIVKNIQDSKNSDFLYFNTGMGVLQALQRNNVFLKDEVIKKLKDLKTSFDKRGHIVVHKSN